MKIKVCHFSSVHSIDDMRIFAKECTSLATSDYDVTWIACGDIAFQDIKNGVKRISLIVPVKNRLQRFLKRANAVYKKAIEVDADIYHFHDPELIPYALKLKYMGKKVIFDSHEDVPNDIKNKTYLNPLVKNFLFGSYKIFEYVFIRKFDAVITVTPHIVDKLKKLNSNTYQITNYPLIDKKDEEKLVYNNEKFNIPTLFFAGGVTELWMHENIIKALDKIDFEIKYIIAGNSTESYLNDLKKLSSWKKCEYLGVIPYSLVQDYYSKAHVGLALLKYPKDDKDRLGTLGNTKLFEIMLAGLPVICTDFILWKQIVEENRCGLCIQPDCTDAIAEAITQLFTNRDTSNKMGMKGNEMIKEKYNWYTQEVILINLYKEIQKTL